MNLKFFLLLTLIITLIKSAPDTITITDTVQNYQFSDKTSLILKIQYEGTKKYVHITVKSNSATIYPYIIYCPDKELCDRENAEQLADKLKDQQDLYIKVSSLNNKKTGYLNITSDGASFSGELKYDGAEAIMLKNDDSYNFVSYKKDEKDIFEIINENEEGNNKVYMTISLNSPYSPKITCDGISLSDKFEGFSQGLISTFEKKSRENYKCTVTNTRDGDNFMTFSSRRHYTDYKKAYRVIPNSKSMEGYLKNDDKEECFLVDPEKITDEKSNFAAGIIVFKGSVVLSLKNQYGGVVEEHDVVYNGEYKIEYERGKLLTYLCVNNNDTYHEVIYSLQIIDLFNPIKRSDIYAPQMHGILYRRFTPAKKVVYYYHTKRSSIDNDYTNFYMRIIRGSPEMYILLCEQFPYCEYKIENIAQEKNIQKVKNINNMFHANRLSNTEPGPLSNKQWIFIVACRSSISCIYETLFFDDNDYIILKPYDRFTQFSMSNEFDRYKFEINELDVQKLVVSLNIHSGDAYFHHYKPIEKANVKYLMNKQEIIYESDNVDGLAGEFTYSIRATKNAFYSIEYQKFYKNNNTVILYQGLPYLTTIYISEKANNPNGKDFYLHHFGRYRRQSCYQANFYALNCKVSITRETYNGQKKEILTNGYLGYDTITNNSVSKDPDQSLSIFKYNIKLNEMDNVRPNETEPCMIQISSIQNDYRKGSSFSRDRELLIGENVLYNVLIDKNLKGIRYIFPYTAPEGNILIKFTKENKIPIEINIRYDDKVSPKSKIIVDSENLILSKSEFSNSCPSDDLCRIILDISPKNPSDLDKNDIKFTFVIKTNYNFPNYIKKGLMKLDTIPGNNKKLYYYTDVGYEEEGEISINIERGTPAIYARLYNKNGITEKNPNWMGKIHFPNKDDKDLLISDPYSNKIYYFEKDTLICTNGCFLLITIENTASTLLDEENLLYDISLMARVNNGLNGKNDITEVLLNKYVVGKIFEKNYTSDSLYQYYSFKLTKNTKKILIEFRNSLCNIFVKRGSVMINERDYNYQFSPKGEHNIFEINSDEEFKKDEYFTLAIGTSSAENLLLSLYVFRIRIPEKYDIIPVESDQNILCNYKNVNEFCYFNIYTLSSDKLKNMYVHTFQDNLTNKLNIYMKYVDKNIIDENREDELRTELPNRINSLKKTEDQLNSDYLYTPLSKNKDQYLIIAVNSNNIGIITLLTSFVTLTTQMNMDPSAYQLFYLPSGENINLFFPSLYPFVVHFVSIQGSGKISLNKTNETFELKGNNDILGVLLNFNNKAISVSCKEEFGFYIFFEYRGYDNFDEIEYGTGGEMYYDSITFPLTYYCKIPEKEEDVDIIINMKKYYLIEENNDIQVDDHSFKVKGTVLPYSTILKKKKEYSIQFPWKNAVNGIYDPSLKIIKFHFTKEQLKQETSKDKYIYISIEKSDDNDISEYKTIFTEYSVFPSETYEFVSPYNQYNFGSLKNIDKPKIVYKLKKNLQDDNYMKIEFSANNNNIKFQVAINYTNPDKYDPIKNNPEQKINGKQYLQIKFEEKYNYLYLIVYSIEKPGENEFTFRYVTSNDINKISYYDIYKKEKSIKTEMKNKKLNVYLKKLIKKVGGSELNVNVPVTYYLKAIPSKDTKKVKLETITISNVNSTKSYKIISKGDKDVATFEIKDYPKDQKYDLIVTAITREDSEILYYDMIPNAFDYGVSKLNIIILILVIIIIVVVAFLAIKVYLVSKEKEDYKKQIDQLSFGVGTMADNPSINPSDNVNYNKL